jgi:hypothetical protein
LPDDGQQKAKRALRKWRAMPVFFERSIRLDKVALPLLVRTALDSHLVQRGLPVTPSRWEPPPLQTSLTGDTTHGPTGHSGGITPPACDT